MLERRREKPNETSVRKVGVRTRDLNPEPNGYKGPGLQERTPRLLTCRVFRNVHPTVGSEFLTAYHEILQILRKKRHNLK